MTRKNLVRPTYQSKKKRSPPSKNTIRMKMKQDTNLTKVHKVKTINTQDVQNKVKVVITKEIITTAEADEIMVAEKGKMTLTKIMVMTEGKATSRVSLNIMKTER